MTGEPADEALMSAYADGDADAFKVLYGRHKGPLYRYFLRHVGDSGVAEELFQDTWLGIIRARRTYRPMAGFRTWLYTVARNRLVDHFRRSRGGPVKGSLSPGGPTGEVADPASADPAVATGLRECLELLLSLIGALPWVQRQAFLLREEAGMTLEQIATVTGVKYETAKSRLRYAMARLREGMEECL
jgi:RNA polymerase sigma-70 factor (ECF subfamily)